MEEQMTEQKETEQPFKILKADEVIAYLENMIMYLEALQQDMIKNINQIKETKPDA